MAHFRPQLRAKETRHHCIHSGAEPCILILDEPTAGQDYRHYSDIMDFLREINRLGITIILITHDMHLMLEYTPRRAWYSPAGLEDCGYPGFGCTD